MRSNRFGPQSRRKCPGNQVEEKECSMDDCDRKFMARTKRDKFCDRCKRTEEYKEMSQAQEMVHSIGIPGFGFSF